MLASFAKFVYKINILCEGGGDINLEAEAEDLG